MKQAHIRAREEDDPPEEQSPFNLFRGWLRSRKSREGEDLRDTIEELIDDHDQVAAAAAIDPGEIFLLRNILSLHDKTAEDVMVPRADIVAVEVQTPLDELIKVFSQESHSRMPVYRETLDDVLGMVHIKDVMRWWRRDNGFVLAKIVREVIFAAPSMSVLDLLAQMRDTRIHMALVVDEFGGVDGLISIEDLVEEIVGEIEDEHDDDPAPEVKELRNGLVVADARVLIEDFEGQYGRFTSDEEREDIDTLGGLVFALAGRVPVRGELVAHPSGVEFEVIEADPRRVRQLRIRNLDTLSGPQPNAS